MNQPEALRIAAFLEQAGDYMDHRAAAELRKLHAEVERLTLDSIHTCHAECQRPICRLTRQRDALLEACKRYDAWADPTICTDRELSEIRKQMRAAIAAVEGEEK